MAKRGIKTMLYGPMKPVGLSIQTIIQALVTGSSKHRMQLSSLVRIMRLGSLYNIVGFPDPPQNGENKSVSSK